MIESLNPYRQSWEPDSVKRQAEIDKTLEKTFQILIKSTEAEQKIKTKRDADWRLG